MDHELASSQDLRKITKPCPSLRNRGLNMISRRNWLRTAGGGFGALALCDLLARDTRANETRNPLAPRLPHFAAKARSGIFLFMYGGPSHVDLFDPKPEL